jgi:hypothetical protein
MSHILYYSNYCDYSKQLIVNLREYKEYNSIHFINIDNRFSKNNQTYVLLENQQTVLVPSFIDKVPSLLNISNHQVSFGNDIYKNITKNKEENSKTIDSDISEFSFGNYKSNEVMSDQFSFYDQGSDEMLAKGDGGLRQMHRYVTLDYNDRITTPDEDYESSKIKEDDESVNLSKLQEQRAKEIVIPNMGVI